MSDRPGDTPMGRADDARLDALLDAFFDKELGVDDSSALFKGLRTNPAKAREFAATRRFVEDLRAPVAAPDLAGAILDAVDARRPWLHDRDVWGVRLGRLGLVAALLLVLGGTLLHRRATPDAPVWNAGPAPLTELVRSSGEATQRTRENAQAAFTSFRADPAFFGVTRGAHATAVAYKPAMPDLPEPGADLRISTKPLRNVTVVGFPARDVDSPDRDVVMLRFGVEPASEPGATLVTFRPR